jgi:hypothetical protein
VRSPGWKLTDSGELFDMRDAPFVEKPIAADAKYAEADCNRCSILSPPHAMAVAGRPSEG